MKKNKKVKQNGITLIALVITIIVLLILAGVSISLVAGENGILKRAQESARVTNIARDKEMLEMEVAGALDESLKVNLEELKKNIGNSFPGVEITESEFPVTVTLETGKYSISEKGEVERLVGISISEKNVIIEIVDGVAGSKKLTATLTDINGPITWSSSVTGVATVDNDGKVTAVGEGTTEITAKCEGEVAKCNVTVKNVISIREIKLKIGTNYVTETTATQEITIGEISKIIAETDTGATESITWESTDTNIATVEGSGDRNLTGIVKGEKVSDSEVTITAKGAKGVSASVKVKIIPAEFNAEDIASSTTCPVVMRKDVIVDYVEYKIKGAGATTLDGMPSTDWQVLYADNDNIYLTMKYTTTNPLGTTTLKAARMDDGGYATGSVMLSDIKTNLDTQKRFPVVHQGLFSKWMDAYYLDNSWTSSLVNARATMYLLDSENVWNDYIWGDVNEKIINKGKWAIGGPTMELFAKSYDKIKENEDSYGALSVSGTTEVSRGYVVPRDFNNIRRGESLLNNDMSYWIAAPINESDNFSRMCIFHDSNQCVLGLHPDSSSRVSLRSLFRI